MSLSACASTPPKPIIDNPARPMIAPAYEKELRQASQTLQKEAMKHEWDWQGYADKMESRTWPRGD